MIWGYKKQPTVHKVILPIAISSFQNFKNGSDEK